MKTSKSTNGTSAKLKTLEMTRLKLEGSLEIESSERRREIEERFMQWYYTGPHLNTILWNHPGTFQIHLSSDVGGTQAKGQHPQTREKANNNGSIVSNLLYEIEEPSGKTQTLGNEVVSSRLNEK